MVLAKAVCSGELGDGMEAQGMVVLPYSNLGYLEPRLLKLTSEYLQYPKSQDCRFILQDFGANQDWTLYGIATSADAHRANAKCGRRKGRAIADSALLFDSFVMIWLLTLYFACGVVLNEILEPRDLGLRQLPKLQAASFRL